jgi:hypothetical protein
MILCILFGSTLAGLSPLKNEKEIIITMTEPIQPYEALWLAVCLVESGNNRFAINKKEQAYGIAQIRKVRLKDYEKRTGIHYELKDMFDINRSKSVFMYYAMRIGENDQEKIIRCWNGGEKGMKKRSTIKYWQKVRKNI